jgi:alkylation response protein AidB-like acyl-CoA dehydrogenase
MSWEREHFLTEDERMIQDAARDFADDRLAPLAAQIDREGTIPREILNEMGELGFLGVVTPEEYGGAGLNNMCLTLIIEQINRACASTGVTVSVHGSLSQSPIVKYGSAFLKETFLPDLASGRKIGAYCLSEAGAGSDAASLTCKAERSGNGWVLNGTKLWVTNGKIAETFIIFARTNPDADKPSRGISAFVVPKETPGLTIGKVEDKLGIRGSSTTEVILENCEIPAEYLLGDENQGFKIALETLDGGRTGIATQALGIAQACLEASVKYAGEREQFGQNIGRFQAIQWKIAQMAMNIEAARLLVYRSARLRDLGVPCSKESAMAKLFASTVANDVARDAVQIHGGVGYTKEFPVERFMRDAKITEIYEGTSEVQHIVISRDVLS